MGVHRAAGQQRAVVRHTGAIDARDREVGDNDRRIGTDGASPGVGHANPVETGIVRGHSGQGQRCIGLARQVHAILLPLVADRQCSRGEDREGNGVPFTNGGALRVLADTGGNTRQRACAGHGELNPQTGRSG